jgi:putative membrane protein
VQTPVIDHVFPQYRAAAFAPAPVTTTTAVAQVGDRDGHMDWDWGGGGWIAMWLMMAIFWGGVIALIVWGVRSTTHHHDHGSSTAASSDRSLQIARERYAHGEITDEEFERIKRGLS